MVFGEVLTLVQKSRKMRGECDFKSFMLQQTDKSSYECRRSSPNPRAPDVCRGECMKTVPGQPLL